MLWNVVFTNTYTNVRQSLYLNDMERYENTKYMQNKHTYIYKNNRIKYV